MMSSTMICECPNAAGLRRYRSAEPRPLLTADWLRVVMIHYEVDPAVLRREVPFDLDLYDGRAFVSLVAFDMCNMRLVRGGRFGRLLAAPLATHAFLNVRTYVRHANEPGIYFLAEWLPNRLACLLGPPTYGLPYRLGRLTYRHDSERGRMTGVVSSRRPRAELRFDARFDPLEAPTTCSAGSLDEFLMERYTAFTRRGRRLRLFRIWHPPWPQTGCDVTVADNSLIRASGRWAVTAELVGANHSPGVEGVWMSRPRRARDSH